MENVRLLDNGYVISIYETYDYEGQELEKGIAVEYGSHFDLFEQGEAFKKEESPYSYFSKEAVKQLRGRSFSYRSNGNIIHNINIDKDVHIIPLPERISWKRLNDIVVEYELRERKNSKE